MKRPLAGALGGVRVSRDVSDLRRLRIRSLTHTVEQYSVDGVSVDIGGGGADTCTEHGIHAGRL
jgi:hypothetical protein